MGKSETIKSDEVEYVRKGSISKQAEKVDGMEYVIIRSYDAGCFAGYLSSKEERTVVLKKARRLWYWSGAASLSQLSMQGVSDKNNCKFPCEVDSIIIDNVCEVITATEKARVCISEVKIWEK